MGIRLIKISVVYFAIGVCLGLYMSIVHSYTLSSVHAHINLLGWASLAIAGVIYYLFPQITTNALGKTHFWLHNISLPIMMLGLAFVVHGNESFVPLVATGGVVLVIAILLFAMNVLFNVKQSS